MALSWRQGEAVSLLVLVMQLQIKLVASVPDTVEPVANFLCEYLTVSRTRGSGLFRRDSYTTRTDSDGSEGNGCNTIPWKECATTSCNGSKGSIFPDDDTIPASTSLYISALGWACLLQNEPDHPGRESFK
uniref:Cellulase n=1 Tax=Grammatophora oceanica TaxID=210454 RepID=A0A7S1VNJ6_9STRA|mmetsp:Transcript_51590/g.76957  ORF Transcript_51590/g.76957 Transcript_51590/m.76957 type:complete len:131 (+) Transcript_51590:236-628(+)